MPKGLIPVLSGAVTVSFSLTGADITSIAAAESKEPARAVARMSSTVIVRILTFYVGSVLLIVAVVPWTRVRPGESPFTLALSTMQFQWASVAMSAIILTAVLVLNSAFYVCSRVLFVLAENGDAPQWLIQLNARRVPTRSVWMGSLAGVLGIFAATAHSQKGVCVSRQRIRCVDGIHLHDDRRGAPARAAGRVSERRAGAGTLTMVLSLGRLPSPWGHGSVLIAMALTPDMQQDLKASVLSLAVALGAFYFASTAGGCHARWRVRRPPAEGGRTKKSSGRFRCGACD